MLHTQIERDEILERYVRNQLQPEERQAFEEHFWTCDECFATVQAMERFVAGVRNAADRGLLDDEPHSVHWFKWAFAVTACASLVLAALAGWMYLSSMPRLRAELDQTASQLEAERRARAALEQKAVPVEQAEPNVPLVMLQASRAQDQPATIVLQPGAKHLVLWIEIGPSRYRDFRLEVFSQDRLVTSLDHLERGAYGAVSASVPVDQLPTGDFRITLTAQDPPPASLVGEYHLRIRRP